MKRKKVIGILIAIAVISASVIAYVVINTPSNEDQVVTLTIESEKREYNMGENVTIIVKESSTNAHFQLQANATCSNGAPAIGLEISRIPPGYPVKKALSLKFPAAQMPQPVYVGLVPYVINDKQKTYKFTWNQTIIDLLTSKIYRAPSGFYIVNLGHYAIDEGFGTFIKTVYNEHSIFFIHGLNYTLSNNKSKLYINSTGSMNFQGKLEFWEYHSSIYQSYFTSIPFTYTGEGIVINLSDYLNTTILKESDIIYIDTPYGQYWVDEP